MRTISEDKKSSHDHGSEGSMWKLKSYQHNSTDFMKSSLNTRAILHRHKKNLKIYMETQKKKDSPSKPEQKEY